MSRLLWCSFALFFAVPVQAADPSQPLTRIAFGSCADQKKVQPIWKSVFATKPELFLFMGDNIYADLPKKPADVVMIKNAYAEAMKQEGYQKLFKTCPVLAMWDDHDYGVNDGGVEYPFKKEAQQLLLDFTNEPKDSPRRTQEGVYFAKVFGPEGKRVQVILLDTRYFRSALKTGPFIPNVGEYIPNNDPQATMLGEAQWAWFAEQLKVPADVRLIVSTVQLISEDHQWERWANMPLEQAKMHKLLKDSKATGIIFLSGDRHLADMSMRTDVTDYPLYDITSSGLNQGFKGWRVPERNRYRVASMSYGDNFGLITIDWEKPDPLIAMQLRDVDGDIIVQQKIPLSLLKAGAIRNPEPKNPTVVEGVLTPAQAAEKVNSKCTVQMKVLSTGASGNKELIYLNSEPNFRNQGNFTIALSVADLKEKLPNLKGEDYQDKTVQVTGVVTKGTGGARLMVKSASDLKIVDATKKD